MSDPTERLTADDLRYAEKLYQRAQGRAERFREERNAVVRQALADGWTHAAISQATGLSRGRISQIKT